MWLNCIEIVIARIACLQK
ncbi:hypothetical protein F383_08204 [Gossypium arboreum]|uniref:Uncharacterized protein n=1 Tax=Gossypium arboreum TaxID=29729 RepID=A0A0B0NPM9_GOSAR|nr:hypothetical protein F383_08204 [Gossypium arboreum]